jgi:phospho-N-acetylmuramoyl-pentapeptide-transferase
VIYRLLYPFAKDLPVLNVVRYITFRTAAAAVTALLLSLILGPPMIRMLKRRLVGQPIREEGPKSHLSKAGTPTMGGLLILLAVFVATFLWMDLSNRFVWIALGIMAALGLVGFADDYTKVSRKRSLGLTGRAKLLPQFLVAFGAAWAIQQWAGNGAVSTVIAFPFLKKLVVDLGIFLYIPFVATVLVGSSNAVNLTDGLDGLAIGSVGIAAGTYAILTYVAGNAVAARYLQIPFVPQSGELAVFCGALAGASLGFLWFNCHPAEVIMGDVGSLPLGGAIGAVAVMTKQEMLLAIVGGLFVMEALSVIIQVVSFKTTGRRVFRMAPLHHHFELAGWAESRVIIRFWILAVLFSVLGLSTLKLR